MRTLQPVTAGIALALAALAAVLYAPAAGFGFVSLDDPSYIVNNLHVLNGMTAEGVRWAFTAFYKGYWIPLTWLSYMVDSAIAPGPAALHLTNLVLHAANTALVFVLFDGLTRDRWKSAFVAAIFAVHPLHVESVAWITERKDVLSTFFALLAMLAYAKFALRRSVGWYALVAACFVLSLMAKPMTVTLPALLLLFDVWPLRRDVGARALIIEKLPLFGIAAACSVLTFIAQRQAGAVADLAALPLLTRLADVLVGYGSYLLRTAWPTGLAAMYAFPDPLKGTWIAASAAAMTATSALAWVAWRRGGDGRAFLVGWAWFVIGVLPVSGLIQAGTQWTADRFMYLPLIGLSVVVAWGVPALWPRLERARTALATAALVSLAVFFSMSYAQLTHWRDGDALWRRVLAIGERGDVVRAHMVLGLTDQNRGALEAAAAHFDEVIRRRPQSFDVILRLAGVHNDIAVSLATSGREPAALDHFGEAARLAPDRADFLLNYGVALARSNRTEEAIAVFEAVLRIDPNNSLARRAIGRH